MTEGKNLPELCNLGQPAIDLIAHRGDHIVDGDQVLLIDESLAPNLRVHLVAGLEVLADVILLLRDARQLLATVDIHARLRLTQHGTALNFVETIAHLR